MWEKSMGAHTIGGIFAFAALKILYDQLIHVAAGWMGID
jgi:hypothetical protein